jgi:type IV secretory pathway TraG/TraD family ATPase VirD4
VRARAEPRPCCRRQLRTHPASPVGDCACRLPPRGSWPVKRRSAIGSSALLSGTHDKRPVEASWWSAPSTGGCPLCPLTVTLEHMIRSLTGSASRLPPGVAGPVSMLAAIWLPVVISAVAWLGGQLATALTGHGWAPVSFGWDFARRLAVDGPGPIWPGTPPVLVWIVTVVLVGAVAAPAVAVAIRLTAWTPSLARAADLGSLTGRHGTDRARQLRPSLARSVARRPAPADLGIALGRLGRRPLRTSWEDVVLAVMAPRAGKTTALAVPAILDAPGAVIATSNKADLWAATAALRAERTRERVWVFDPQQIAYAERTWWWNPLRDVTTVEEAGRLAGHFVQEIRDGTQRHGNDFWTAAAHDLLTSLLLAAAASGRDLTEVYEWLNDPVLTTPVDLLRTAGHHAAAASLLGRMHGAPETRDGVYETARTAARCLRDDAILAWVTPPAPTSGGIDELDAATMATSRQTLYLLSKDGAGAAAPLVAALTDRVLREATRAAERAGGRLDPPLVVVLDEAANVCRIADLPDLYSHLGSRGIIPITILQSYKQGVRVWGEHGMDTLWSAATIKLIGPGLDDARLAEDLSRLIGEHDVPIRTLNYGDRRTGESLSVRRQRILGPEDVRALPRGTALLFATGCRAALIDLQPWYAGPDAEPIRHAIDQATLRLTHRASRAGRTLENWP